MKLKNLIAVAAMTVIAVPAFALTAKQDLTSDKGNILVKNRWGECVKVYANRDLTDCGVVAPPAPEPTVETVVQTEVITLGADTYFAFNKYNLNASGKEAIQQLANKLNSQGARIQKITVVGNTDSIGTAAYNQKLSERRAATVANYLIEQGVNPALIQAYGNGERDPVASNATPEGRAQNRRVVITVDGLVQREVQETVISQ